MLVLSTEDTQILNMIYLVKDYIELHYLLKKVKYWIYMIYLVKTALNYAIYWR